MSSKDKNILRSFSELKAALETGKDCFADLRPPRYNRHKMQWIVSHHKGKETVEHSFDTEAEAETFYHQHKPIGA